MGSIYKFPSGLNNWIDSDKPERIDFVEDNEIIDENAMWKEDYDPQNKCAEYQPKEENTLLTVSKEIPSAINEVFTATLPYIGILPDIEDAREVAQGIYTCDGTIAFTSSNELPRLNVTGAVPSNKGVLYVRILDEDNAIMVYFPVRHEAHNITQNEEIFSRVKIGAVWYPWKGKIRTLTGNTLTEYDR